MMEVTELAGHVRTTATGTARRTSGGKLRQVRVSISPDQRAAAKRDKQLRGALAELNKRLRSTNDPVDQFDYAREFLRSAIAKYNAPEVIAALVTVVTAAGEQVFKTGVPKTAAQRQQEQERRRRPRRLRAA